MMRLRLNFRHIVLTVESVQFFDLIKEIVGDDDVLLIGINGNLHGESSFFCPAACRRPYAFIVGGSQVKVTIFWLIR